MQRPPPAVGATMAPRLLSQRAREQVSAAAREREGAKPPRGGPRGSEGASRWELLTEPEGAHILIAELAEKWRASKSSISAANLDRFALGNSCVSHLCLRRAGFRDDRSEPCLSSAALRTAAQTGTEPTS